MIAVSSLDSREAHLTIPVTMKVYSLDYELPIFFEGFESGVLDPNIWTQSTTENGRIRVSNLYPNSGSYSLLLDCSTNGIYSYARATMQVDMSKYDNPVLRFSVQEFNDEIHAGDGVFISDDGLDWVRIFDYSDIGEGYYHRINLKLAPAAFNAGVSLSGNFYIRFQFYDNYSIPSDGYGIDDIELIEEYPKSVILSEGFEDGAIDPAIWTQSTTGNGRIQVSTGYPFSGSYSLLMDCNPSGTYSYASITTCVDLRNYLDPTLTFHVREFNDDTDGKDGLFISDDGIVWIRIMDFSQVGSSYRMVSLDLASVAAGAEHFYIRFQFYDNYSIPTDGYSIDNIELTGRHRAVVPRTGQTTSYYTGDDGDLEIGIKCHGPRFVDNGDGTLRN